MPKTKVTHPDEASGVEVFYDKNKKLKEAVYDAISGTVTVYYDDESEEVAYPSKSNPKEYRVKRSVEISVVASENNYPGLSALSDSQVRDLLIKIAKTDMKLHVPKGTWRAGVLTKANGLRSAIVYYDYEIEE